MYALSAEPVWLDLLPGIKGQFRPIGRLAYRAARKAASAVLAADPEAAIDAGEAFSEALIRAGLIGWTGIGDTAGKPLKFSPPALEAFLLNPRLFEAADRAYVSPFVLMDAEKKRLRALAAWHFGGENQGQDYCKNCEAVCAECPYAKYEALTEAAAFAWDVLQACGRQLRVGLGGAYGLDFTAVLATASAMGGDPRLLAETLPLIEPILIGQAKNEEEDDAES